MANNNTNTSPRMSIPHHSPPNLFLQQRKIFIFRHWTNILQAKYTATLPITAIEWLQKLRSDVAVLRIFHRGFETVNHRVPLPAAGGEDENPLLMAKVFGEQIDEALSWFKVCHAEWGLTEELEKLWMEVASEREAAKKEVEERKMWKEGLRDRIEGHKRKRERVGEWIQGVESPGPEQDLGEKLESDGGPVIKKEASEDPAGGRNDGMGDARQSPAAGDTDRVLKIETPAPTPAKTSKSMMAQPAPHQPTPILRTAKKPALVLAAKPNKTHAYPMPANPANGANNQRRFDVRDTWPIMVPIPARPDAGSRSRYPMPSDYAAQNQRHQLLAHGPPTRPGQSAPQPVYPMLNYPQKGASIPPGMPNNVSVLSLQPPLRPRQAGNPPGTGAPAVNGAPTPWMRYPAPLQQRSFGPRFPHDILRTQSPANHQPQLLPRINDVRNYIPNQVNRDDGHPSMLPRHPNGPETARLLPNGGHFSHANGPYFYTGQRPAAPANPVNPTETAHRNSALTGQWNDLPSTDFRR